MKVPRIIGEGPRKIKYWAMDPRENKFGKLFSKLSLLDIP